MSAMTDCASTISPPPPAPCSTRAATNCGIVCASEHSTDATRNTLIDTVSTARRPYKSPNFPYSGELTVEAIR